MSNEETPESAGEPIAEESAPEVAAEVTDKIEAEQVPIPEDIQTANALNNIVYHGLSQLRVISGMISQADTAIEKARSAPNEGPQSVIKMILPVMIGRRRYLKSELALWEVVIDAACAHSMDIGHPIGDASNESA